MSSGFNRPGFNGKPARADSHVIIDQPVDIAWAIGVSQPDGKHVVLDFDNRWINTLTMDPDEAARLAEGLLTVIALIRDNPEGAPQA